jgi:hypothetical protein
MESEPYIPVKPDVFTQTLLHDELSRMLSVISSIPDGMRLFDFPRHVEGPDCWCRPQIDFAGETLIVTHKDLNKGEFDC